MSENKLLDLSFEFDLLFVFRLFRHLLSRLMHKIDKFLLVGF